MSVSIVDIEEAYKVESFSHEEVHKEQISNCLEMIRETDPASRQRKTYELARLLILRLSKFTEWELVQSDKNFVNRLVEGIEMLAYSDVEDGERNAHQECLRFVNRLRNSKEIVGREAKEIVQQSQLFWDILPSIKGIFQLNNEEGNRVYPIHELVISTARGFQHDNEHLITLALAQQLFESVKQINMIEQEEEIRSEILKLAEHYQIAILQYLSDGGKLQLNELNYQMNGTVMAISKDCRKVIIRNNRKEYFSGVGQKVFAESDNVAWYIVREILEDEELVDIGQIMNSDHMESKLNLLKIVEEEKAYNIFLPKMLVCKKRDHSFRGILNPCAEKDNYVVVNGKYEASSRKEFLNALKSESLGLRASYLLKDGINILTVDFYCTFFLEVVKDRWKLWTDFKDGVDFYQKQLISAFLAYVEERNRMPELMEVITDFYLFLRKYLRYSECSRETKILPDSILAYPYGCILPDTFSQKQWMEKVKHLLFGENALLWSVEHICYNMHEKNIMGKDGSNLKDYKLIFADDPSEKRVTDREAKKFKTGKIAFVNRKEQKIYYDEKVYETYKRIGGIQDISDCEVIGFHQLHEYDYDKIEELQTIMKKNGLKSKMYELFQCHTEEQKKIVRIYKILWHFQIYGISGDLLDKFWKLILEKYYKGCIEKEELIQSYFAEMNRQMEEENALVIAKEASGDDTTLYYLYKKFGYEEGKRKLLSWAFDSDVINRELKVQDDVVLWRGKSLKKIFFMVDNTINGGSLKKMLRYYLEDKEDGKRKYLILNPKVSEIKKTMPDIPIEVHIIFGLLTEKEEIEDKYNVKIQIYEKIPEIYKGDKETIDIAQELYGVELESHNCYLYRYNNMTAKNAFPDEMMESMNLGGLFQKKGEL